MADLESFASVGLALAAGLLVGLEREQSQEPEERSGRFLGGIRTFPLFALLGALPVLLGRFWLVLVAFACVGVFLAIAYADDVRKGRDRGLTTEIAVLVTFLLGVLACSRDVVESLAHRAITVAGLSVIVTLLLSSKPRLHALVENVSREDLYATIKFLLVAVLVLPLLPNRTVGPLDVLNPFSIGLMVVLIAGIGFMGYVATRVLGPSRGLAVTALLGGLVSSTAVTLSFAGRARKNPKLAPTAAAAILLASAMMFGRILVEVSFVHLPLLAPLSLPLGAAVLICLGASYWVYSRTREARDTHTVPLNNPFDLGTALRFGLVLAVVLFVSRAAQLQAGTAGLYVTAALAGTTDVDAITLSTANLARSGMDGSVAVRAILIGAASNTLVKVALAYGLGGRRLGTLVLAGGAAALAGATIAGSLLWLDA